MRRSSDRAARNHGAHEAFAIEQNGQPVTLVRYRVANSGTQAIDGTLSLLVRPLQVNPPWQHGGASPIREIAIEGPAQRTDVRVGDRVLLSSLSAVDARGAALFGRHGETEITAHAAAGTVPDALEARDDDGLAAALLNYRVRLAPGAHRESWSHSRWHAAARCGNETVAAGKAVDRAALGNGEDAGADSMRLPKKSPPNGAHASRSSTSRCPTPRWSTACARRART